LGDQECWPDGGTINCNTILQIDYSAGRKEKPKLCRKILYRRSVINYLAHFGSWKKLEEKMGKREMAVIRLKKIFDNFHILPLACSFFFLGYAERFPVQGYFDVF
jgi:hypothetical protein